MKIKYSFIIPVKEINDYIRESIPKILEIRRNDYEIIIYPDKATSETWKNTKQIASGPGGPAMKRSLAARDAQGEILIFIDDDAYPEKNFLDILDRDFRDEKIIAAGGPAITPRGDNFWQKVSGAVYLSYLSGANPDRYVSIGGKRFVNDWPSVNLSVRKSVFEKVGGFDSQYWPGEDTKFCLDIMEKTGKKILYNPDLVVYHHRREGLARHLKQAGGYGLHRGFFAKKFPKTSFKVKYFIPSGFVCFAVFGLLAGFYQLYFWELYALGLAIYGLALVKSFFDIRKYEGSRVAFHSLYYIILTHLIYGIRFMQGFIFTRNLKSKLR